MRNEDERKYLLPETDPWAGVEGEERETIRDEVLLESVVQESIRIEFLGCQISPRSQLTSFENETTSTPLRADVTCG